MIIPDGLGDPAIVDQPYDFYSLLRSKAPVFFSQAAQCFIVSRYADVQRLIREPDLFRSVPLPAAGGVGNYNFAEEHQHLYDEAGVPRQVATLAITEGCMHRRYRGIVDAKFGPSAIKHLEPNITEITDMLIDRFIDRGEVDLYADFCLKMPLFVMCDLLGWSRSDTELLGKSADALSRLAVGAVETPESRIELHKDQIAFHRYAMKQVARVRAEPDESIMSHIVHTMPEDGRPFDDAELVAMASILNIGGNETTTNGLGSILFSILSKPDAEQMLRHNRDLIPKFIEEALRTESPVTVIYRWTYEDTEIGGVAIPAGSMIMGNLGSANRDEEQFGCPERIDLDRKGLKNHLAFGGGVHYCLGVVLARLELKVAVNRLLDRLENMALAPVKLRRRNKLATRALEALPITFSKIS